MKRLILRAMAFVLLYVSVAFVVRAATPFYWASGEHFQAKMQWYVEHADLYDTLFLGSSRVLYQIDPVVFDEAHEGRTRSFNLGEGAVQFSEAHHLLRRLIQRPYVASHVETIFLDVTTVATLRNQNRHTTRHLYYLDWPSYRLSSRFFFLRGDRAASGRYVRHFIDRSFLLGVPHGIAGYFANREEVFRTHSRRWSEGFLRIPARPGAAVEFFDDYMSKLPGGRAFRSPQPSPETQLIADEANRLVELAAQKGIRLIFVNMPPNIVSAAETRAIFTNILESSRIDLENPQEYPDLLTPENFHFSGHLNEHGAAIATKALAREHQRLMAKGAW